MLICTQRDQLLEFFANGANGTRLSPELRAHLGGCAECMHAVDGLLAQAGETSSALLPTLPPAAADELRRSLRRARHDVKQELGYASQASSQDAI